ncbi:hypothetical protein COCON_G00104040 [Conger conger]|uniref:Uncharacterized protein n=1 Tax=Conger conger TaxID=82655 RepID=A0A9Q1HZG0_CONCO|nr:hypothetical protein COCON_G00104040 [Conger conger]
MRSVNDRALFSETGTAERKASPDGSLHFPDSPIAWRAKLAQSDKHRNIEGSKTTFKRIWLQISGSFPVNERGKKTADASNAVGSAFVLD